MAGDNCTVVVVLGGIFFSPGAGRRCSVSKDIREGFKKFVRKFRIYLFTPNRNKVNLPILIFAGFTQYLL